MSQVEVVQVSPLMPEPQQALEAAFTVHRCYGAADREAVLGSLAGRARAVAGGGASVDAAFIDALPRLEIIANLGVGYDAVDAAYAGRKGVVVTNTPDVLTDEVADLTLGLILATVRRLPQADRYVREGRWPKAPFPLTGSLRGRTIGILGLGRIGKAIATRCAAFGVPVAYYGRRRQPDVVYTYHPTLPALAAAVDVLVVVAPGGAETRGIVDAQVLRALGPDGILINVGRGSVVDEPALVAALQDGTIAAAGLDVFAHEPHVPAELIALDNVVLLPHVGSASVATRNAMSQLVVDNLINWFAGRGPVTPVAETPWPPS
ncbi:2-hydroxyacid dehydrogenase [Chelatococcus reniformis]|uniref:Glycerate dehydrogenase n=1 Tax=Chelatococcus reniformis TaxID=1494448 RepID=A0A916U8U3_9HYPH|nr:2-hydroxyacid dehydrogenase [Chelatococcus reniformis]GGC63740.1 glycerate dehydrogenase [Chelatococcus reniformis]